MSISVFRGGVCLIIGTPHSLSIPYNVLPISLPFEHCVYMASLYAQYHSRVKQIIARLPRSSSCPPAIFAIQIAILRADPTRMRLESRPSPHPCIVSRVTPSYDKRVWPARLTHVTDYEKLLSGARGSICRSERYFFSAQC